MKKIVAFLVLFMLFLSAYSQEKSDSLDLQKFYLEKSVNQRNTGLILLGSGTTMIIVGAIGFESSWESGSAGATDALGFMILAGVLADLISIPVLISSGVNKRKSLNVSFTPQKLYTPNHENNMLTEINYTPALTLRLTF
ncbi:MULTISPECIES: hypothetical protein [unclassified Saccharicrinis]|uniref:hypothetical protein n=1 Tax=unclassified Saccharicrinis TaxID=2646859 RepID=UPI003D32533B